MTLEITAAATLQGIVRAPSDKSLTHRAYMFAAIASGESRVRMPLRGEDCESTLRCLNWMGLRHEWITPEECRLIPAKEWEAPMRELDCGNSGTTMRLLSGLIASRPITATLIGDHSLSRRPMKRVADPLRLMGAVVEGDRPPLTIRGGDLHRIDYVSLVASAQVKSCVLLAGLRASGTCSVTEPSVSRDHTERMLLAMGANLTQETLEDGRNRVSVEPTSHLKPFEFTVPADISSAAFFMVGAAILPEGRVTFTDLSVNPSRTGILDVLEQVGIPAVVLDERSELGEPVADVVVSTKDHLLPFVIEGDLVPRLVDEIPVLAVLATQCNGRTVIKDAKELRVKESDRIELMADGLRRMGAVVETFEDGMAITGPSRLKATTIEADGDHRIAMAFAIAGLIAEGTTVIHGADSIATSFPNFTQTLESLIVV